MLVYVGSRTTDGDGGEGWWRFDSASSATANGGTILAPDAGSGRWLRVFTGPVLLIWFASGSTGFQAALDYACTNGLPLRLPDASVTLTTKITQTNKSVVIEGSGFETSKIILSSAAGGLDFTLRSQTSGVEPDRLILRNFSVQVGSGVTLSSPAIDAEWASFQGTAAKSLEIVGVRIQRHPDGTGSFTDGIKLKYCFNGIIDDTYILGDDARVSARGFSFISCVGIRMPSVDANRCQTGFLTDWDTTNNCEGITVDSGNFYDCNKGVDINRAIHVLLGQIHTNSNTSSASFGVRFKNCAQSKIIGSLIYTGGSGAASQDGIIIDACNTVDVIGNTLVDVRGGGGGSTTQSIRLTGSSIDCIVTGNYADPAAGGVSLKTDAAGDSRNTIVTNRFPGGVTDNGTSNTVLGNAFQAANANQLGFNSAATGNGVVVQPNGVDAAVDLILASKGTGLVYLRTGATIRATISSAGVLSSAGLGWNGSAGFGIGTMNSDASWGGLMVGRSGTTADLAMADSSVNVVAWVRDNSFWFKPPTRTQAELRAIGDTINTTGKFSSKLVWDSTNLKPVFAQGSAAGSVWGNADGTTAHTPV